MTVPKVAIGLPVFNGEQHIREAILALLNQTFDEFVVLISDNCSNDNTLEICRELVGSDRRFNLVSQRFNVGAVPNFNYVARNTSSQYFKWMAADDTFHPRYLESCVQVLDSRPDVGWCHCRSDMIDEHGKSWLNRFSTYDSLVEIGHNGKWWKGHPRRGHNSDSPIARFRGVMLGTTWSVDSYGLIRRRVLNQTRLLEPLYGAEKVLLAELSLYSKYHHIQEVLFSQRIHRQASGNIVDKGERQAFIANQSKLGSSRLALLRAHLISVVRCELSTWQKLMAYLVMCSYLMQIGKWSRVIRQMLSGGSVRGGGHEMMERAGEMSEVDG